MKLYEFEGKKLFETYRIAIPRGSVIGKPAELVSGTPPFAVKAQTLSGDRNRAGGILFTKSLPEGRRAAAKLFQKRVNGEAVAKVLVEEKVSSRAEYYLSFSYSTDTRTPVLAVSPRGGSRLGGVKVFPVDMVVGAPSFFLRESLCEAGFPREDLNPVSAVLANLWKLFIGEYALLAEINPLIKTPKGDFVAADAKVILDDEKKNPGERRLITMDGDIAILASGGGASLLNIDMLLRAGGKPANYTEYSGNPPAAVVKDLTKRVLHRRGLRGAWIVGGTANFTDIYETMRGFLEGLREVTPKPRYPIVIRRDGPRQREAVAMLSDAAEKGGYDFHIFGSETSMAETAKIIVELTQGKKQTDGNPHR